MYYNALRWLCHHRRWETHWVFLLSVWSTTLLKEGFYLCCSRGHEEKAQCPASPSGEDSSSDSCWPFALERCQTQDLARMKSTQRRVWNYARPFPPRSLGTNRASGKPICGITSSQLNKHCICLIDVTHWFQADVVNWHISSVLGKLHWLTPLTIYPRRKSHTISTIFQTHTTKLHEHTPGLFICTHKPEIYKSLQTRAGQFAFYF